MEPPVGTIPASCRGDSAGMPEPLQFLPELRLRFRPESLVL